MNVYQILSLLFGSGLLTTILGAVWSKIKINEDIPYRHYSKGDSSEVIMYFEQYDFLVMTLPRIHEFILENSKKSKKTN